MAFQDYYRGKKILLTGHTGFKGSWLSQWLLMLGAEVHGFSLNPEPHEKLYDQLNLSSQLASDTRADLRDREVLKRVINECEPDIIFHLAAQPLVRLSYEMPIETFEVNAMGTAYLLDAIREAGRPCTVVCVTTDKCYENREWLHGYRENESMGGHDPYSASKGVAELIIQSYRRSFFTEGKIKVASARAGNVIGGGDWALDRIVPDCIRAIQKDEVIEVRNKVATRPWQHVLEPLSGYLLLGKKLDQAGCEDKQSEVLASGFNFGPALSSNKTVEGLVIEMLKHFDGKWDDCSDPHALHEASKLNLATDKAFHLLDWLPVWNFEQTIEKTAFWYRDAEAQDIGKFTQTQIKEYEQRAQTLGLNWSK